MLWSFVVNLFVLFVFVIATAEEAEVMSDIKEFANLAMNVGQGKFKPLGTKNVINISEMEEELDSFERKKRDVSNQFLHLDPTSALQDEDESSSELEGYDVSKPDTLTADTALLQDIKLPLKAGSPAFKIIASKVYILYPSMFQDPNIFGRFSIPQSINMEKKDEMPTAKETVNHSDTVPMLHPVASSPRPYYPSQQQYRPQIQREQYNNEGLQNYHQQDQQTNRYPSRRMFNPSPQRRMPLYRRQVPNLTTESPAIQPINDNDHESSIDSHIRGQIVVQNQDVYEYNNKNAY